jgi:hypothetical protein
VVAALLVGTGLTTALPGVGVQAATAEKLKMFPVDWRTNTGRDGQTRVSGYIHNNSGDVADRLRLEISGLNAKDHVVPTTPSYRVDVDRYESFQAP